MAINIILRRHFANVLRRHALGRIGDAEFDEAEFHATEPFGFPLIDGMADKIIMWRKQGSGFSRDQRREMARWILFLWSEEEYVWPDNTCSRVCCDVPACSRLSRLRLTVTGRGLARGSDPELVHHVGGG